MAVAIEDLRGRIVDADSHEFIPTPMWQDEFGEYGAMLAAFMEATAQADMAAHGEATKQQLFEWTLDVQDDTPITDASVWRREGWDKVGPHAPGAIDMRRRLEVLDLMGVDRQVVFSGVATIGIALACASMGFIESLWGQLPDGVTEPIVRDIGRGICTSWNDWCIEQQKLDPHRLQMVSIVESGDFDHLMAETERLLAGGVRAIWIPTSVPPGGKSPADRAIDPFWSMCEQADATIYSHLIFEEFQKTHKWKDIPEFDNETVKSNEFVIDPWSFSTQHFVIENFLNTIILGGVFERHPNLRFGVIECGAHWVGPMAENLDKWANLFSRRMAKVLSDSPSSYVQRNIRATPYWFEPVAKFVERYGLEDVYVYGSDYPHFEGGTDQLQVHAAKAAAAGDSFVEKYFVTNAAHIVPGARRRT